MAAILLAMVPPLWIGDGTGAALLGRETGAGKSWR